MSDDTPDGIAPMEGTSMAAPHVAGAIALALASTPIGDENQIIEQKLRASAFPLATGACPKPVWRRAARRGRARRAIACGLMPN